MSRTFLTICFLISLINVSLVKAQATVRQVADLNTGPNQELTGSVGIFPTSIFFDNKTLLRLRTPEFGSELWLTDGTPQNTRLFADMCPGQCSSDPNDFYIEGGNLYFAADDGQFGRELWRLPAGTLAPVLVSDINPGAAGSNPNEFRRITFRVGATPVTRTFFAATRVSEGRELWRLNNGSSASITPDVALEADIANGAASSSPIDVTVLNTGKIAVIATGFTAFNGPRTLIELNHTSSTEPPSGFSASSAFGTSATRSMTQMITLASNTYISLLDRTSGFTNELWVTQGGGTALKLHSASRINNLSFNTLLFRVFFLSNFAGSDDLFVSDGTTAGTVNLTSGLDTADQVVNAGNRVLFTASTAATGRELFKTDGTVAGTALLKELISGNAGIPRDAVAATNALASTAMLGFNNQLWISDNTAAGTVQISGAIGSTERILSIVPTRGSSAILSALPSNEPFFTQGTAASTIALGNFFTDVGDSFARPIAELNQRIIVNAELAGETTAANMSLRLSGPLALERLPRFFGTGGIHFGKLWASNFNALLQTDATAAGSTVIDSVAPEFFGAACVITRGGLRYFIGVNRSTGTAEVYRSNGVAAGTVAVSNFFAAGGNAADNCFTNRRVIAQMGSDIYFIGGAASTGQELQKLDANEQITLVADIRAGAEFSFIRDIAALDDRLIFAADDGIFGEELWVSRGTGQTTIRLTDLNPGAADSRISQLTRVGNQVYFMATTPSTGTELYVSDGTAAGTRLVVDLFPGPGSALVEFGNTSLAKASDTKLVFRAVGAGCQLFETLGVATSTRCIYNENQHTYGPVSEFLVTPSGTVVFSAFKRISGTGEEIRAIANGQVLNIVGGDIAPGVPGSAPSDLLSEGETVYFQASDGSTGRELYQLTLPNLEEVFRNGFE